LQEPYDQIVDRVRGRARRRDRQLRTDALSRRPDCTSGSAYAATIRGRYDGRQIAIRRCDERGVRRLVDVLRWTPPPPS
jgi:hypothetical protein